MMNSGLQQNVNRVAPAFAALGDSTRLALVLSLSEGRAQRISDLAENRGMSRQAVTKHLKILEKQQLIEGERKGREVLFKVRTERLLELGTFLEQVGQKWDQVLHRLKAQVEES